MTLTALLQPYQHFGVHLGLERIKTLLAALGNPQDRVPFIHVAGTNGKGSVCAYLSSVLHAAGYRVGRYTSPHLIDWPERFWLNGQFIDPQDLEDLCQRAIAAIDPQLEPPTVFEIVTAVAWLYFAEQAVDVAVIEVGLGGRLDATNVSDRPLVSVITSLSLEHWQRLGPTLSHIAREKAGILKPGRPAVIGQLPPEAAAVVRSRLTELACPAQWVAPAQGTQPGWATTLGVSYPLPLKGDVQLQNSALAIATLQTLQQQGWSISGTALQTGMAQTQWPGRLQPYQWQGREILLDGAHNPAAAAALRQYLDTLPPQPIAWVMGMLTTKDHSDIFKALLRGGDCLHLVPVPDHLTATPEDLATLAQTVCPDLAACDCYEEIIPALTAACDLPNHRVVCCGSLYLLGHFLRKPM